MTDRLYEYIRQNRASFDQLAPPDVWTGIANGLQKPGIQFKPKNYKTMIKYGFGASAIVVATFVALQLKQENPATVSSIVPQQKVTRAERTIFDSTPSVVSPLVPVSPKPPKQDAVPQEPVAPEPPVTMAAEEVPAPPPPVEPPPERPPVLNTAVPGDSVTSDAFVSIDTTFRGVTRLEVSGVSCNVTIISHKNDHVHLQGEIKEGGGKMVMMGTKAFTKVEYKIRYLQKGELLKVWIEEQKLKKYQKCEADMQIESFLNFEVPEKTMLQVYNSSGDITVKGAISARTDLKTNFGNIKADNISAELVLSSTSGNITATGIHGKIKSETSFGNQKHVDIVGDLHVRSNSGNVTVTNITGNTDLATSFGHQVISNANGHLKSTSSSGDITVKQHHGNISVKSTFGTQHFESIDGDIEAGASSGDIRVTDQKGQLSLGTSFGSIRGKNITLLRSSDFKASSGNISMTFLNQLEDLSFDLTSSSGNLAIERPEVKKKADNELHYGNGPIRIKGITSFGNQSYH
jgi:hypothetical protein